MSVLFEHRLSLAGYRTRVLEVDGEGPPLLLFHGWSDSADTWRAMLDVLRRRGRRAVALDMPGFGTADPFDPGEEILPQLDRFARIAITRFSHGEPVVLAGNSLGGCAVLRAAQDERLPVAAVAPIAPAGLDMAGWFQIVETERLLRLLLASPLPVPSRIVRETVGQVYRRLAFAKPGSIHGSVIGAFTSHVSTRADVARILDSGRRLRLELRDPFRFDRITCPVLLIWGDRDRMVFPTSSERVLAEIPGARFETIPGCGHCPQIEAPERTLELIEELCAEAARERNGKTVG